VGVGTGRIALPLARQVRALFGVDLARPMLDRLCAKRAGEPVHVSQGDAARLPFPPGVFDSAVAVHVFHLIGNWQAVLEEVARVLVPGGRLLNGWNDHARRDPVEAALWRAWEGAVGESASVPVGIPQHQLGTCLIERGWHPVGETQTHRYPLTRTPQTLLDRLERRVWSRTWQVSDDDLARGLAAVRDALRSQHIDPQEPRTVEAAFCVQAFMPPG